ncbi:MAG: glutamate--cysteine ligase [Sphingomonadales bacterium]|nr:glutamate--cysteine ligase [Sphingomonadales bacterium]
MADTSPTVENKQQLVDYIASGEKPRDAWRIGTEHEKFCYHIEDLSPLEYEGEAGIKAVLEGFTQFGWAPVYEGGNIIALSKDGATITLEPGGQLELSGAPLKTIHQTCDEVHTHLYQAKQVGDALGVGYLGVGFHPLMKAEDAPHMPKGRYKIMREYMPKKGTLGLDMMHRTCTIQVNLDFSSEADMVKKFRTSLALQSVATALFATSPFSEGKPNGFKSYRSQIWTDTDPDRTGMLPFVFDDGFGYERYVDYMLDVPMYFAYRPDRNKDVPYMDATGLSFKDFLAGKLPILMGEKPTMKDWEDHMTTAFPEVRLKKFLEMRGADGGPWSRLCALPAFWVGLMYDQTALDAAWDIVKTWSVEDMIELRNKVPKEGLATTFSKGSMKELAIEVLDISEAGLKARGERGKIDTDERGYIQSLRASAESGRCPADEFLDAYNGRWQGDLSKLFGEMSY